jgi:antitoxin VapB
MPVQLNIKGEEAYSMAAELAELTGESLTTAVTAALRERLDRLRRLHDGTARLARVRVLAEELRAHLHATVTGDDVAANDVAALYGPEGLPVDR